jgi:conjugal transfer/entry exclusion protein
MRRGAIGLVLGLLLLCPRCVQAQGIPVYDNANFIQNVVTAVQTVIMVGNQVLELTGLDEIVLGADLVAELDGLQEIMHEAQGLSMDLSTIQLNLKLLFDLDTAPRSSRELRQRMAEIRRLTWTVYVDALRAQTLMQSTVSALRHMVRLIEAIGDFLGNNQGNQTLAQLDVRLSTELIKLKTQTAAFHRAQAFDRLAEPLMLESIEQINEELMRDYPQ